MGCRVSLNRFLKLWGPVIVWAALIFALSSIPSLNSGLGTWDEVLRKCAHVTEYAILGFLLLRAIGREAAGTARRNRLRGHRRVPPALRRRAARVAGGRPDRHRRAADRDRRRPALLPTISSCLSGKDFSDRQLEAILERLDRLVEEVHVLNRRLDSSDQLLRISQELSTLNESLQTLAYAALGQQGPQVRRRRSA